MSLPQKRPIIVVKKVADHDDGHGGAWKVAYADFVTAMMALFIVLWLLSASEKVQRAVGGYFQDPTGKGRQTGTTNSGAGEIITINRQDLQKLKEKLEEVLKQIPSFQHMQKQVKMTLTTEGLRIDLIETEKGLFFASGNPRPTDAGTELLKALATELAKIPNKIAIEGHTDSRPFGRADYSNWELSADRANAARRVLAESGLEEGRISQVRGFADQRLLKKDDPTNPANRRISIIVRNDGLDKQEESMAQAQPAAPEAGAAPADSAKSDAAKPEPPKADLPKEASKK